MSIQSSQELLVFELQDIQDAETQASQALQGQMEQVENPQLRKLLERRLQEGERILGDVRKGLEKLGGGGRGQQNAAARGLIQEAEKLLKQVQAPEMKQAVMISGVQKLEHYCIAAWGTVKAIAGEMGEQELAQAMQRAVDEGYRWDREMTELAEGRVNPSAMEQGQGGGAQQGRSQGGQSQGGQSQGSQSQGGQNGGGDADLKAREYRGEDGKIHHHTREYMERKGQ